MNTFRDAVDFQSTANRTSYWALLETMERRTDFIDAKRAARLVVLSSRELSCLFKCDTPHWLQERCGAREYTLVWRNLDLARELRATGRGGALAVVIALGSDEDEDEPLPCSWADAVETMKSNGLSERGLEYLLNLDPARCQFLVATYLRYHWRGFSPLTRMFDFLSEVEYTGRLGAWKVLVKALMVLEYDEEYPSGAVAFARRTRRIAVGLEHRFARRFARQDRPTERSQTSTQNLPRPALEACAGLVAKRSPSERSSPPRGGFCLVRRPCAARAGYSPKCPLARLQRLPLPGGRRSATLRGQPHGSRCRGALPGSQLHASARTSRP